MEEITTLSLVTEPLPPHVEVASRELGELLGELYAYSLRITRQERPSNSLVKKSDAKLKEISGKIDDLGRMGYRVRVGTPEPTGNEDGTTSVCIPMSVTAIKLH